MGATTIEVTREADTVWVSLPRLTCAPCKIPNWTVQVLGTAPEAAATCGPAQGYLVLAYPDNFNLKSLSIPDQGIAKDTARAIIVTCRITTEDGLGDESIHMRYFAPQYGVAEDSATGSAMRVLAEYWRQRGLGDTLVARQQSEAGGYLVSRIEADRCWIGGRVVTIDKADND